MSCPLDGNPPASYQWYLEKTLEDGSYSDSVPVQPSRFSKVILLNNDRTLFFWEFKEEHNGFYSCYAENFLGNKIKYLGHFYVHSE